MTSNLIFSKIKIYSVSLITIALISVFILNGCSSTKQKGQGDLASTRYCKAYIAFENRVATAKRNEQLRLLKNILSTKDFPKDNSLKKDYELVIDGYEKVANGQEVRSDEKAYKEAVLRINRHAVEHCNTLKSQSGVSM